MINGPTLILRALRYYGQKAVIGQGTNEQILNFFKASGHPEITEDEIPWCSAFINAIVIGCGGPATKALNARSWLKVGTVIEKPDFGDIVVFWRGTKEGWQGHVGLVVRLEGIRLWVLGGNQDNMVEIKEFNTENVLGYRRLEW